MPRRGHVLFDVHSYEAYGRLSGRSVEDMIAGARVEVAPYKRDPMDFVLWKPSSDDQPGWDSPWGRGRPGWHIECSAMSHALLGESFDIHGGGIDLQFPHHENEIAQSCCAHPGGGFARIWMHNEMLQVEGKKMSKSLGNFFTVRDLLEQGVPGEVIRFVMLSTHYSKPMDWTEKKREEAEKTLERWHRITADLLPTPMSEFVASEDLVEALADDLNTHLAFVYLRALQNQPQKLLDNARWLGFLSDADRDVFKETSSMFSHGRGPSAELAAVRQRFYALRNLARQSKDFTEVDAMKTALADAGIEVRMSKDDVELIPGVGFDPAKLEALK
jgi:cysteinyl-tRNA synthetase